MAPTQTHDARHPDRVHPRVFVFLAVLAAAALAAYWNTFSAPFVLDDTASITENPSIRRLWPLGPVFAPPANVGVGGRPLSNLSLALNFAAGGFDVRGYHVVNLAIHVVAALVLFGLIRRTLALPALATRFSAAEGATLAFGVGLLWALHPLQTEAVTYVSQRTETLMALFYLLTLYCFVRGTQGEPQRWFSLSIVTCVCGMATKEVMVTAPVIVFLFDRTFVAGTIRGVWEQRKRIHLALAATWAVLLFLLVDVHERGVGYGVIRWWEYALTSTRAILFYLRLALWPAPLVFDYGTEIVRSPLEVWPQMIVLGALVAATVWALWRRPFLGFLGAWVFIILAPASSVVPVGGQPMAEHRMYLPLVAVVVAVAVLVHWLVGRRAIIVFVPLGLLLLGATVVRNRDYRDVVALWSDTIAKRPLNARAHAALGAAYVELGQLPLAIGALERAVQLDPASADAHNNLATTLTDVNRMPEAIAHFSVSLKLRPEIASTHYNLGNALLSVGRASEAIAQQQQALILQRNFPEALCALANAQLAVGRLEEALENFHAALRLSPNLVPAHFWLANALAQSGRGVESIPHYEATLRAVPNSVEARYNFGCVLLASGRPADAALQFAAAVQLRPDFAEGHHNLANALVLSGHKKEAAAHYETALRMRPDSVEFRASLEALRNAK